MTAVEIAKFVTDLGTTGVLLLILWQGLKRFDMLLNLVITLAARGKLSGDDIEEVRTQVFGSNGKTK
jgi:hypothetical protein